MKGRRSIIVIDDFYSDPGSVREWALSQDFYYPYSVKNGDPGDPDADMKTWQTTWYRTYEMCPFKSNKILVECLEDAVGEQIDMDNWKAPYPVNNRSKPINAASIAAGKACLWNCSIHVKPEIGQQVGHGIHNHVTDRWNGVGANGWAGIIYLTPNAPVEGGLHLWKNEDPVHQYDWMSPAENWVHLDQFANIYNRLVLVRGNIPHSGANGWSDQIEAGRMYQTFFFRTYGSENYSVDITRSDLKL